MSTRAQILVEGHDVLVYKHCDGYPDGQHGVLHWLKPVVDDFMRRRGFQADYMTARILVAGIDHERSGGHDDGILGWGLDTEIHGDIAYLYTVKRDGSIDVQELWKKVVPDDDYTSFHARLKVTLDEIREACGVKEGS